MTTQKRLHELAQPIITTDTLIVHQNKVLMFKRSENKKKFPGFWAAPGGHVDADEDPLTCSIREIKEETGVTLTTDDVKLKAVAMHHHTDRKELYIVFIFLAQIKEGQKIIQETREGHAAWIDINELLKMGNVLPPLKYYFDHVLNDKPGIMYNNSQWKDSKLVKVLSEKIDRNN